jgi:hypothetical protein
VTFPESLDRDAVIAVVAREFDLPADRIRTVEFATNTMPTAVVTVPDLDLPIRVCEAVGIDLTVGVSRVEFDPAGATVHTIDGETHRIPFTDQLEATPCPE